jgi:hypothetical protein
LASIFLEDTYQPEQNKRRVVVSRTQFSMMAGGDVVAGDLEQGGDRIMDGDEAL